MEEKGKLELPGEILELPPSRVITFVVLKKDTSVFLSVGVLWLKKTRDEYGNLLTDITCGAWGPGYFSLVQRNFLFKES